MSGPITGTSHKTCQLRTGAYNCEGFLSAASYIADLLGELDVLFLSETWLSGAEASILDDVLCSYSPEVAADTDAIPSTAVAATPTPATEAPSVTRASDLRVIPPETPTLPLAEAPPPPRPVVELPPRPEATPWSRHSAVVGTEWTRLTEVAKSLPPRVFELPWGELFGARPKFYDH